MSTILFAAAAALLVFGLLCDHQASRMRLVSGITFECWQMTTLALMLYVSSFGVLLAAIHEVIR